MWKKLNNINTQSQLNTQTPETQTITSNQKNKIPQSNTPENAEQFRYIKRMTRVQELWALVRKSVFVVAKINIMQRKVPKKRTLELIQNENVNKWVILPDSVFKNLWEILVILFMIYTATILPFRLSFYDDTTGGWVICDQAINYFFMADIVINLFSAYYDQENLLITNNIYIAINYAKGWMLIDFISVIPISDIITYTTASSATQPQNEQAQTLNSTQPTYSGNTNNYNTLIRLVRLPRLYKLIRILRLLKLTKLKDGQKKSLLGHYLRQFLQMDASIRRMLKIMGFSLLFTHLSACFFFMIAKIEPDEISWVKNLKLENEDTFTQYVRALYWSLQTLTTVGFGDVPAQTNWEKIYAIFWMGVGSAFFSFMISNLQGVVNETEISIQSKITRLEVIKQEYELPEILFQKIRRHIECRSMEQNRSNIIQQAKPLIKQLPTSLKSSVQLCIYAHVIEKIKFLQDKEIELIMAIIPKIQAISWKQGEILYENDDYADEVYFISNGEVQVKNFEGYTFSIYSDGDSVGTVEIIYDVRRIGTAVCTQNSQLYSLDRSTYLNMLQTYPQVLSEIKQQMEKRIGEIQLVVEDYNTLNRSVLEVIQEFKRKKNKIDRFMEQIQSQEHQEQYSDDHFGGSLESYLEKHPNFQNMFYLTEQDITSNQKIYFDSQIQINILIEQLAQLWSKQLTEYIKQISIESPLILEEIKDRLEYYRIICQKFSEIEQEFTETFTQFEQNHKSFKKSAKQSF